MNRLLHRLKHLLRMNTGRVVSWWGSDDDYLYIGFQCSECGEINGGHRTRTRRADSPLTPSGFRKANPDLDFNDPAQHAAIAVRYGLSAVKGGKK